VVETARDEDGVRLLIEDDGAGIAPDNLDKVFTPFFTTKPAGRGTGLGLAVCHGVVTAHGGRIAITSEVGRGTRVSVVLPVPEGRP
jgi:signal transduction histidine kinase